MHQRTKTCRGASDGPGRTPEPLQSHTSSPKNNALGPSSDEHENPLNGTQPNPFVYRRAPAVPRAGNSLPSGALVNGPASHSTSEVHRVLNKGAASSNNVLDAARRAHEDTSPEVLPPPPSELQSDAWRNTAGPVAKTPAARPGVNTPPSHPEENESKLARAALSGADGAALTHISQPLAKQTIETRAQRDVEWSESSADEYDDDNLIRWDSASLHSDRKHNPSKKNNHSPGTGFDVKYFTVSLKDLSGNGVSDQNAADDPEDEDGPIVDSKLARAALTHISQPMAKQTIKARAQRDVEWSESSADEYDTDSGSDRKDTKHNTHAKNSLNHTSSRFWVRGGNDVENVDIADRNEDSPCTRSDVKYSVVPLKDLSGNGASDHSAAGRNEEDDPEDEEDNRGSKVEQLKTERDPLFFSCTICNVNFKERRRFHRHMMYHLDEHNQVKVPRRPFLCRECGRLFCDSNSLVRHIIIHRDRLEKLIKGLNNVEPENGANAAAPRKCPHCVAGCCNCPKISVQHAEMSDNLKHYYFCEECDYVALTQEAVEAHLGIAHPDTQQLQRGRPAHADVDAVQFQRKMFFFTDKTGRYNKPKVNESKPHGTADIYVSKSNEKPGNCGAEKPPPPSLWRVNRHGKLLPQPVEELDVATALTCAEGDSENSNSKAFGSSTRTNGPTYVDFLPPARRNLKLDQMFCQSSENLLRNSTTMGKMSTPLRKAIDETNGNVLARLCRRPQKRSAGRELENSSKNFSRGAGEATKSENLYSQRCFTERQKVSTKDPKVRKDEADEDCSDIEQLVIKEEFIETTDESPGGGADVLPTPEVEQKPCPYCPAMFESGVGLSNHVRGHLHRVGLSYNARHMVSPEQVALRDHQPKIRRRIPCSMRKARKAVKPDSKPVHTCPLCWGWFDTKTGLSNHVRGHLKRIGQSVSNKSPLGVLKDLLQDQKEHQNILRILNKGFPVQIQCEMTRPRFTLDTFLPKQEAETFAENAKAQKDTKEPASTLVQLLKMKRERVELTTTENHDTYATRKLCDRTKEETHVTSVEPKWTHGCDYKHKKPRPGLKKQSSASMNAERYTLTCRFCDLVFQGPPSIQEDWIKHLQRHLLHTGVGQSGSRMVEVLGLHHKTQTSLSHKHPHLQ